MSRVSWCYALALLATLVHTIVIAYASGPQYTVEAERYSGKFERHRIQNLPGAPANTAFDQYAGYVTVDEGAGRSLFYWLFEAAVEDPQSAPLTLWLNGGPGCSSVGGGALRELGPFFPSEGGKTLVKNPYNWNQVSNIIFLESPAGVGFSYSNTSSDNVTGDAKTAADSVAFILKFLEIYPIYAKRPFYIAGESYAGHYITQLAISLLEKNKNLTTAAVNLKGIAIGNPSTDETGTYEGIFYLWTHALISDDTFNGVLRACNYSTAGASKGNTPQIELPELGCDDYYRVIGDEIGNIDIYDIYADFCLSSAAEAKHLAKQMNGQRIAGPLGAILAQSGNDLFDPCIGDAVDVYLNRVDVQKALHADAPGLPYRWALCNRLNYSFVDIRTSVFPLYETLLKSGIQILIYGGDTDAVVPVTGTRGWITRLNLDIKKPWRPYYVNKQVGGYVTEYDGLTFATVRGSGHQVPYSQPERALHLFKSFIDNSPL